MSFPRYPSYKDSGVAWLGEVPEHWNVCALKRVVGMQSGESITGESIEDVGEYSVFGGNGLRGYTGTYTHEGHYVLIGRQGALCGNINYGTGRFWASEHAVVVTPLRDVHVTWLGELLRAMNLNQYSVAERHSLDYRLTLLDEWECAYHRGRNKPKSPPSSTAKPRRLMRWSRSSSG